MLWADEAGHSRRPVVAIEDHLYHTADLLQAVTAVAPEALAQFTICALDRSGPDTDAALSQWATRFPGVCVVTPRDLHTDTLGGFARDIAKLLRPGGIVLQDIQLTTLPFIPADRWWESIYLGATIRGLFAERPPAVRFCSNKRGYDATFGKDLLDAGFDPRDVMDKAAMTTSVVPALLRMLRTQFPLTLETPDGRMPVSEQDRADVEAECDIVLWRSASMTTLGGRGVQGRIALKPGAPEIETWRELMSQRLRGGDGVAVLDVGARLAEPDAERAEQTNLAARHIHSLRARLRNADAILTANHCYRLADNIVVGLV